MSDTETTIEFPAIRGYDASEIPLDAPPGQWTAAFNVVKKSLAKDSDQVAKFPMLQIAVTLEGAEDSENESYVGAQLKDFLVIWPKGHKNARMGVEKLHALAEALGFDPSVVPSDIETWDDLNPLVEAIDGKRASIWTYTKVDKVTKEKRTQVAYSAPRRRGN